ncbi:lysophospholipid acyltransferase family protein [Segniliparus rugosus]|uniref:1-acylglycerol-3-phosphate O-acyltransferase n=1 Tax=Segniliparus rugosus (strain ATCC BAA-974 / DSM 45345 / CCUG 50838 / CIP 108380 / JCM 13579 / CDC 945) TaxID=679197 RepID=E5XQ17_SEGRC|nr:lysophospholipid acyltransferase family protein [Segniliparus rugosus]EFV13550.1 1-acylglycerol-3-phosphate O-acyltransferase [Segniliparus rugosus ATCC BAA-974]
MEILYGTVNTAARLMWLYQGLQLKIVGVGNMPAKGGAVVATNHTGYLDIPFAGLTSFLHKRNMRFMYKTEMRENPLVKWSFDRMRHIPVDRDYGKESYDQAVQMLKEGELVAVYPETTISRSFELREFKSGSARMAIDAQVPIVPVIVWGSQRIITKGHPKAMGRTKIPIWIEVADPIAPDLPADELMVKLRESMQSKLYEVQDKYAEKFGPYPPGAFWVPKRLGGGAPSLEEANALDEAEAEAKRAKRAAARAASEAAQSKTGGKKH